MGGEKCGKRVKRNGRECGDYYFIILASHQDEEKLIINYFNVNWRQTVEKNRQIDWETSIFDFQNFLIYFSRLPRLFSENR